MADVYWFQHNSNTKDSIKCTSLIQKMGLEGYGIYWMLLELARKEPDFCCPKNYKKISAILSVSGKKIKSVVEDFGLFVFTNDNNRFFCKVFVKRLGKAAKYRNYRRRMYETNVKEWYIRVSIVFKRDNYTCFYCGRKGGYIEADHVIPFSKGGSDELENLITACRRCNRQKKDKSVQEFLEWKRKKQTISHA